MIRWQDSRWVRDVLNQPKQKGGAVQVYQWLIFDLDNSTGLHANK